MRDQGKGEVEAEGEGVRGQEEEAQGTSRVLGVAPVELSHQARAEVRADDP